MSERAIASFMRRKQVELELGISRSTLARLLTTDATFPRFIEITTGIQVVTRDDFNRWLQRKKLLSFTRPK